MFLVRKPNIQVLKCFQNALLRNQVRCLSNYYPRSSLDNENKTSFLNNSSITTTRLILESPYHHSNLRYLHSGKNDKTSKEDLAKKNSNVDKDDDKDQIDEFEELQKLGLFERFKKMTKQYWYVLIPVHLFTSAFWFSGFFYMSKSGVDIVHLLELYNFSDIVIKPFRSSHLGHVAVAYLLYKIATPARYTVTLGGTTFAIKYLVRGGYIKPMPTRRELVQIYKVKRDDFKEKVADKKQEIKEKVADKKQEIKEKVVDKTQEIKDKMSKSKF